MLLLECSHFAEFSLLVRSRSSHGSWAFLEGRLEESGSGRGLQPSPSAALGYCRQAPEGSGAKQQWCVCVIWSRGRGHLSLALHMPEKSVFCNDRNLPKATPEVQLPGTHLRQRGLHWSAASKEATAGGNELGAFSSPF